MLTLNDITIYRSPQVKYLGLIVDEKLNWHQHINELEKTLVKTVKAFRLIKNWLPKKLKLQIYYAYIHSKIKYGITLYGTACKAFLNKIQVLQNRTIKILFNLDHYTPTKYLLKCSKLLSVKDLYQLTIAQFVHRNMVKTLPTLFKDYFQTSIHSERTTRQTHLLKSYRVYTEQAKNSVRYTGTNIWNELTLHTKIDLKNLSTFQFKNIVKDILLNRY